MSSSAYYRPSLRFPVTGVRTVAVAALLALPLAWCYALATAAFPAPVNPLVTAIVSFCLAMLARRAAAKGKVRHPAAMGSAAAAVGLLAWYAQWVAWIVLDEHFPAGVSTGASSLGAAIQLFFRPDLVVSAALDILEQSATVFGKLATIVLWTAELLAFVLFPKSSAAERAGLPFCEDTQEWATLVRVPSRFAFIDDPDAVKRRLEADPAALPEILGPTIDPDSPRFVELTFYRCAGSASFVTLDNLAEMAPDKVPLPRQARPANAEYFAQVDGPVVELLRFPVSDPGRVLARWAEQERAREVRKALARQAAAESADKWTRE